MSVNNINPTMHNIIMTTTASLSDFILGLVKSGLRPQAALCEAECQRDESREEILAAIRAAFAEQA